VTLLVPIRDEHPVRVDVPTEDGVGEFLVVGLQLVHTHLCSLGDEATLHLGHGAIMVRKKRPIGVEVSTASPFMSTMWKEMFASFNSSTRVESGEYVAYEAEHAVELHGEEVRVITCHLFAFEFATNRPIPNRDASAYTSFDENIDFIKGQSLEFDIFLDSSHLCGYAHTDVRLSL